MLEPWLEACLAAASSLLWTACSASGPLLALLHAALHPLDHWAAAAAGSAGRLQDDGRHAVPVFGSFSSSLLGRRSFQDDVESLYSRYSATAVVGAFEWRGRPCLLVRDPTLVGRVLGRDAASFATSDGAGVGAVPRAVRERLSPLLLAGRVDAVSRLMADCGEQLVQSLSEEAKSAADDVEVLAALSRYCTAVVGSCAFGVACNCIQDPDWQLHRVAMGSRRPSGLSMLALALVAAVPSAAPFLPACLLYPAAACFYVDMLRETAAFRERTRTKRKDFVDLMMSALPRRDPQEPVTADDSTSPVFLTERDRRHHCGLAYDVVAAQAFVLHSQPHVPRVLARCLLELAGQPALQQRVADEVLAAVAVLDDDGAPRQPISLQVLERTPLLEQVILEALRLEPPCAVVATEVGADGYSLHLGVEQTRARVDVDGDDADFASAPHGTLLTLAPRTQLYVPVRALHRDPGLYPEPEQFRPEQRFSPEARRYRPPGAYAPFGELTGDDALPRGLPAPSGLPPPARSTGARFALQAMWLGLAALLADLEFGLSPRSAKIGEGDDEELWLRVNRRTAKSLTVESPAPSKTE